MRAAVNFLAGCVFLAGLVFDTEALIRLPYTCAIGGCGRGVAWVAGAIAAVFLALVAVGLLRRPPLPPPPPPPPPCAAPKRRPATAKKPRTARPPKQRRVTGD